MNTVDEKLNLIENSVSDIKQAINDKGGSISGNISTYASAIRNLPSGGSSDAIINQNVDGISPLYVWQGTEEEWNTGRTEGFYNWKSGDGTLWSTETGSGGYRSNTGGSLICYGNGLFLMIQGISSRFKGQYSQDGKVWADITFPSKSYGANLSVQKIIYDGEKFLFIGYSYQGGISEVYMSSNLVDWETFTMPTAKSYHGICYGNGVFVTFIGSSSSDMYYSSDGINWTKGTMPNSSYWSDAVYVNNKFTAVNTSGAYAESVDGINWTLGTIGCSVNKVIYGNGVYVAINGEYYSQTKQYAYSVDGVNWTVAELPYALSSSQIAYGNGYFLISTGYGDRYYLVSTDGINWEQRNTPYYSRFCQGNAVAFGKNRFTFLEYACGTNYIIYVPLSAFTDTPTPDTSSTVYSEPFVESSLTITETGTNTITLSDGNVYDRNRDGDDIVSQSIGELHPDYISFIDGVGVRIGTTDIADM